MHRTQNFAGYMKDWNQALIEEQVRRNKHVKRIREKLKEKRKRKCEKNK